MRRPQKVRLAAGILGSMLKMLFAFWFQEKLLGSPGRWTYAGVLLLPPVNLVGNALVGGARIWDAETQYWWWRPGAAYPGSAHCRRASPHAVWHEQSANALVDFIDLAEGVDRALRRGRR